MKNTIDKAKSTAADIAHGVNKAIRKGVNKVKKGKENYLNRLVTSNKKADERAEKKNPVFSASTPDGRSRISLNPKSTKNGGTI